MDKRDARKISTEAQQELRELAVRLKESGKTYDEIAKIVHVHPTTICTWYKAYQKGGIEALKIQKRGRRTGTCKTLTPLQEVEIQNHLIDKCPDQLKLPFALWTRIAVQQLINELFSIKMPIRTVGEYLMRWNFTPQRPLRKAYKRKRQINPIFRSQYDYAMVCHYQPTMEASHENSQSQTFILVCPYQGMEFFRALSGRILPRIPSQIKFLHLLEATIQRNSKPPRLDPCSGLTGNPTSRAFVNPSHHSSWQYLVH